MELFLLVDAVNKTNRTIAEATAALEAAEAAKASATSSATTSAASASSAADSAALAQAARDEAEAFGGTNDTIIAGRINDPESETNAALSAAIAEQSISRYTRIDVVADHGADNTGATSAVAAFEAALAAANTALGKVEIMVPPGSYNLTAGLTTAIVKNHVHIIGAGMGITTIQGGNGTLFTWGDGGGTSVIGGGMRELQIAYTAPHSASRIVHINGASSQKFQRLFLANVRQLARLGESGAPASAPSFRHVYGSTENVAGSVVIDAAFGTALSLNDVIVNAAGVSFPTDTTTLHGANDTTFLRFGQGSWDTAHCYEVISNRYNRGLNISAAPSTVVTNLWFTDCVWDYCKTNGILISASGGGNARSYYFIGGWAVATDGHSIEVANSTGTLKNVHFKSVVGRQAGKNNWRFSGSALEKVTLSDCHGLGANRLDATNVGSEKDDLAILGSGVTVRGGSFGEDGSSYTGFACQGRYGITRSVDVVAQITDVELSGATGGIQAVTDTTADRRKLVTRNRRSSNAMPEYATTTSPAAPASAAVQTHTGATLDTLYIYGGTVTSVTHNATQVGDGSGPSTLNLRPGDTWSVTYSVAPTIRRIVAP